MRLTTLALIDERFTGVKAHRHEHRAMRAHHRRRLSATAQVLVDQWLSDATSLLVHHCRRTGASVFVRATRAASQHVMVATSRDEPRAPPKGSRQSRASESAPIAPSSVRQPAHPVEHILRITPSLKLVQQVFLGSPYDVSLPSIIMASPQIPDSPARRPLPQSCASRLSVLTSSIVAARAVSPASRRLPASRNSFDQE